MGLEKRDMAQCAKAMHKDHLRYTHPRTAGKPVQNKEEYLQHTGELVSLWTKDCEFIFHSVIETPGKVILHFSGTANTSIGVEMNREMIWIGHIVTDEDGSLKLKQIEEFTDSKAYLEFFKAVEEAKAKRNSSAA